MITGRLALMAAAVIGGLMLGAAAQGEEVKAGDAVPSVVAKHSWTEQTARVEIQGLAKPVRVLHITDVHLNLFDERDKEYSDKLTGRHLKFLENPFHEQLQQILAEVPEMKPDFIAITGDIIHFPSKKNIETLLADMNATGVPWMFVPGNHDWHWPYDKETDELRAEWIDALRPLAHGGDPSMQTRDLGGIRFVGLDDSTYAFTQPQLDYFKQQLASGKPVVLLIHIPLYAPDLREKAIEVWKPHSLLVGDTHWLAEERNGWGARLADTPESLAFVETAKTDPNLVAVLAGHLHFPHAERIGPNAVQYVGKPPFDGLGRRLLDFVPMGAATSEGNTSETADASS